jgi:hypothetical protein
LSVQAPLRAFIDFVQPIKTMRCAASCFLRQTSNRKDRYAKIAEFVHNDALTSTVDFQFLEEGIRVNGNWYPILKMEWVNGRSLNHFVQEHLYNTEKIAQLADKFRTMVLNLGTEGIAHGDLQHGNILLCENEIRLVDYDGMYVPSLSGEESHELGHPNYQHPLRSRNHFGPYLDNFSSWIIYLSLRLLTMEPALWQTFNGGDEKLLFTKTDFTKSSNSLLISNILTHKNVEVRQVGETVLKLLSTAPDNVPSLEQNIVANRPFLTSLINGFEIRAKTVWHQIKHMHVGHKQERAAQAQPVESNDWYQNPDWRVSQQSALKQQSEPNWYDEWANTAPQNKSGAPTPPGKVSSNTTNRPVSSIRNKSIPTQAEWSALNATMKQQLANGIPLLALLSVLNDKRDFNFLTAAAIAAYRCQQGEFDAEVCCFALSGLIINLRSNELHLLPELQSNLELAFHFCSALCQQSNDIPAWLWRDYFRALDALLDHASRSTDPDFYSYFRTWIQLPSTTSDLLENHLLTSFKATDRDSLVREETIKAMVVLLDLYNDLKLYSLLQFKTRLVAALNRSISDEQEQLHIKLVAQLTLHRLS